MSGQVTVLKSKADFDSFIQTNALVVIDFYADWCGPCRQISPKFVGFADEDQFRGIAFAKVNVDENEDTASHCAIAAMPTFIFFKDGKRVAEVTGANETKLKAELGNLVA